MTLKKVYKSNTTQKQKGGIVTAEADALYSQTSLIRAPWD